MAAFIDAYRRAAGSTAMMWLIGLNVGVWALSGLASLCPGPWGFSETRLYSWLVFPSSPGEMLPHIWTALTYMVTQFSFLHMLVNVLWLYWFGRLLLTAAPQRHLWWLYVGGGLTGVAAYAVAAVLDAPSGPYLCGASASVLAVVTATGLHLPDMTLRLFLFGEVKLKWVALACIVLTMVSSASYSAGAIAAHWGGVAFGAAFALALRKGFDPSAPHRWKSIVALPLRPRAIQARTPAQASRLANTARHRLCDSDRLDQLLDKIRISGYQALSSTEKNELNAISARLQKK